ncbi:MAG: SDR family oxidoreductase [Candidatus Saccharibacteria bacterium]
MQEQAKQTVVIIGGTAGIGLATAQRLLKNYTVVIIGRNADRLQAALQKLGDKAEGYVSDARDKTSLEAVFQKCGIVNHVVVAAANHGGVMPLESITAEALDEGLDGKLRVHLTAAQVAQKFLASEGSLTFISAITARSSMANTSLLAAVNGAIASMVPALAVELAPRRVNAVLPGVIDTDWWEWLPGEAREGVFEGIARTLPAGRIGKADDVADAIAFLVGNTFTTGVLLPCDGGSQLVVGKE